MHNLYVVLRETVSMNIAVVVLDTLRKDTFEEHFDWLPGTRIDRAYSTANWTAPAHGSLFTGQYPREICVTSKNQYFNPDHPPLPVQLSDAGYTTRAFSANTNITGHFNFDQGFSEFYTPPSIEFLTSNELFDWGELKHTEGLKNKIRSIYKLFRSKDTVRSLYAAIRYARSEGTPGKYGGTKEAIETIKNINFGTDEFLFLNLMEAHEPYRVPNEYQRCPEPDMTDSVGDLLLGTPNGELVQRSYQDAARYLSDIYNDLFELLNEEFDMIVTLSDHGELLGEHGAWAHEFGVYPELIEIPLVFSGEGSVSDPNEPVSLVDVYQTVAEFAGVKTHTSTRGISLTSDKETTGCRLAEYSGLRPSTLKRIEKSHDSTTADSYDSELRGIADGEGYWYETLDGTEGPKSNPNPSVSKRLDRNFKQIETAEADEQTIPDTVQKQLENLGYK